MILKSGMLSATEKQTNKTMITVGREIVYKPGNNKEEKEKEENFPEDVRTNKQKGLEEWDSACTIYKPYMPDLLQLLKLSLPPDLKEKVTEMCEIPITKENFPKSPQTKLKHFIVL